MATKGDLPMDTKGGAGIVDQMVIVCRSVVVDRLMFSLVVRVCFAYGFRSIWNLSPSRV